MKRVKKKLDKAFSLAVRERDRKIVGACMFCGGPIECVFHVVTRSKHCVRWDLENGVGSCSGCNRENEYNPDKFRVPLIKAFGLGWYEALVCRSVIAKPMSLEELQDILLRLEDSVESGNIAGPKWIGGCK